MKTFLYYERQAKTDSLVRQVGLLRSTRNPETGRILTYQEIADQMGTTRQNVYRLYKLYLWRLT